MELSHVSGPFAIGLAFLYKATQTLAKFHVHLVNISRQGEPAADMHRLKVRSVRAIIASGNRYALTVEHLRIVLNRRLWWHLNECKVLIVQKLIALHIAAQHTHIVLTSLRLSILAKQCFQIHANVRVAILFHFSYDEIKIALLHLRDDIESDIHLALGAVLSFCLPTNI